MILTPRFAAVVRDQKHNPTLPQAALDRLGEAYGNLAKRRWGRRFD
jgi:hypothetical protein